MLRKRPPTHAPHQFLRHLINHMRLPRGGAAQPGRRDPPSYYANWAILWMANSQSAEAILTELDASRYHPFEPAHQATESFDSFGISRCPAQDAASSPAESTVETDSANSDLISLILDAGFSSNPISEFRAAAVTRINSSSFS